MFSKSNLFLDLSKFAFVEKNSLAGWCSGFVSLGNVELMEHTWTGLGHPSSTPAPVHVYQAIKLSLCSAENTSLVSLGKQEKKIIDEMVNQ